MLVEQLLPVVVVEVVDEVSELGCFDSIAARCVATCRLVRQRGELALVMVEVTAWSMTGRAWYTLRVRGRV